MSCESAQLLMIPMWAGTLGTTDEEKHSFEAHLIVCQACAEEYEETKRLMSFVKKHWGPISTETQQLLEHAGYKVVEQNHVSTHHKRPMTVEEGWQDLCKHYPDLAESTKKPKSLQLFLRMGAVAACLVIGVLTWMAFSIYSESKIVPESVTKRVVLAPNHSIRIELVSENGIIPILANQQITCDDEFKTLILNGKHRMMMNVNTILTVKPFLENSNIGCLVKLASGRIYTHVEHDGNPFIVETAHGQAVITGTTFDVKATENSTTLVVSEGTVQFESEDGVVNVSASQTSEIVGQSAPTNPISCDATELTAWATGYTHEPALVQAESNTDISWISWPWPFEREPTALEEINYDHWTKENRDWFKHQFPQVFQFQSALAKEGIEVDYPQLLIDSGDLWQFAYTKTTTDRFSVVSFNSLFKTASDYGFDKQWLLEKVPLAKYANENQILSKNSLTVLAAFEKWNSSFEDAKKSWEALGFDTQNQLFHASIYLANTRSLIWFAVNDGKYDLTDKEYTEVLALLQSQVNAASICQDNVLYQSFKNKQACDLEVCRQDKWYQWVDIITKNIKAIASAEEKIAEYKIDK